MGVIKEFFSKRIFINCLVFSIPISALFLWRFIHVQHIPFFSAVSGQIYLFFLIADFLIFLFVFFILYWLSKRPQRD